ncbi:MAG: response regulator [Candidatus Limnocylindrales bacterium]
MSPPNRLLLVVEDNPGDARLLAEMLREHGGGQSEVTHVETMAGAEHILSGGKVDLVLLDLGLPDAQGLEAVRRARAAAPRVPLVVLTGLDDELLAVQALQEGAQDYLVKGQIEGKSLLRALRYAIERMALEDGRRAVENQLLQAQKLESVGRLAGGIAHDFNNMLFAITGYAELLTQDLVLMEPHRFDRESLLQSVGAISDAATRASALTGQLLAFSRQQVVVVKVVDLNMAINAIAPMVRQLIGSNVQLTVKLAPAAGHVRADPSQIDQIIVNLIVNARDAMDGKGTVSIETAIASANVAASDGWATTASTFTCLTVTDNGMGMDEPTRAHLFEPFFTTKDVGKGTGLGLASVHGIMERAGGRITVRSEPGHGSTFKLFFPRIEPPAEILAPFPLLNFVGSGRVLVVEDDPAVRDLVVRLLERAGYDVSAAVDGADAIAFARVHPTFDAIVTDAIMPNMSGVELADKMIDRYPKIGVVLLSGYTPDDLDLGKVIAQGATFVAKPVSAPSLIQALQAAIDTSRKRGRAS